MDSSIVMTVIGPDRPGLVESIATAVADHEGNWLESRMARLAGQFAGVLRVQVDEQRADALVDALSRLEAQGLQILLQRSAENRPAKVLRVVHLELMGNDQPGIVQQISEAIAGRRVNVDELSTECISAPMTGQTLFKASATLRVPADVALDDLRADLERIANDLMVDITIAEPQD